MIDPEKLTRKKAKVIYMSTKIILLALVIALVLAVSFFGTAGLVWLICWALERQWSWRLCIAVWCILFLIGSTVKGIGGRE